MDTLLKTIATLIAVGALLVLRSDATKSERIISNGCIIVSIIWGFTG